MSESEIIAECNQYSCLPNNDNNWIIDFYDCFLFDIV